MPEHPTQSERYVVVKMLSGTWNVRDTATGKWVDHGLDKLAAIRLAETLNV